MPIFFITGVLKFHDIDLCAHIAYKYSRWARLVRRLGLTLLLSFFFDILACFFFSNVLFMFVFGLIVFLTVIYASYPIGLAVNGHYIIGQDFELTRGRSEILVVIAIDAQYGDTFFTKVEL